MTAPTPAPTVAPHDQALILAQAMPYIRKYHGKTLVIKYGGNAMTDPALQQAFAEDVVLLKLVGMNPVVVHGGGPQIETALKRLGKKGEFVQGMRVTDAETMEVVEWVLGGEVQQDIVGMINRAGGKAVGLTGRDGGLIRAKKLRLVDSQDASKEHDVGQVGDIESIDPSILKCLQEDAFIPVVSPIGFGVNNESYNINADVVAAKLATVLQAEKLLMLTNIRGVLDKEGRVDPQPHRRVVCRRHHQWRHDSQNCGCPRCREKRCPCGAHHRWARAPCDAARGLVRAGLRYHDPQPLRRSAGPHPPSNQSNREDTTMADTEPVTERFSDDETAPARKRPRPGERRLQILQTLAAMLEQPGAERVTTASLAAKIGVSEAALYRHFASKAQMFEGLIDFVDQSVIGLIRQVTDREPAGPVQASRIVALLLQFAEKNPGMSRVMMGDALVLEHERLQERINLLFDKIEAQLRQSLKAQESATPSADAQLVASLLVAFMQGRLLRFARSGFKRLPSEHLQAALARIL
jgi:acetylglutamate kinase